MSIASAQTTVTGRLILRPVSNDDKQAATVQRSGGLATVGLGQPAYLEAQVNVESKAEDIANVDWFLTSQPDNSQAVLVDSPLTKDLPIFEPGDRTAFRLAGRKMLRPDVAGRYVVTMVITTAKGATITKRLAITGASYVGIKVCGTCHSFGAPGTEWSTAGAWAKTGHSGIFKQGINGVASDHYSVACLGCHTVGYDTAATAANGGFSDVAAKLNWKFPEKLAAGNWDALPEALKNVGNIQCENCHGPGSKHAANGGDPSMISVSYESGACNQCHGAMTHHFKQGEWVNSLHASAMRYPSGAGHEACVGCHTGAGFIGKMKGRKTVDPTYSAINCQTCHDPHGQTSPDSVAHLVRSEQPVKLADGTVIKDAGAGTLCMNCHQARQNASVYVPSEPAGPRFGPHHGPQADMLAGVNAYTFGSSIPSSAHSATKDTCVGCHMQVVGEKDAAFTRAGGHTFKASFTDDKNNTIELVGACQNCHGAKLTTFNLATRDYDEDGVVEGVQTEVQHLMDKLSSLLPPAGKPKTALTIDATWNRDQLAAAYNWIYVHDDGSLGVHNPQYAAGILKASIAKLGGTLGPAK